LPDQPWNCGSYSLERTDSSEGSQEVTDPEEEEASLQIIEKTILVSTQWENFRYRTGPLPSRI
jgi:hypothetical protein